MKATPLLLVLALFASAGAAQAQNCTIKLDGNDQMKYDQSSVTVNASCETITVELNHTGSLPAAAMGHNVVIAATGDVDAIARDGVGAGAAGGYLKADDARVIAHTDMIGGGQNTSVSFPGSTLTAGSDYSFFCTFPGHAALMRGTLVVEP